MSAFTLPLQIDQGSTFTKVVVWKTGDPATPVVFSGCSARAQFRANIKAADTLYELSSDPDGGITLGATDGTITITISATDTASFAWKSAVYDLEIVFADGTVRRLLRGAVTVSPEVTRD